MLFSGRCACRIVATMDFSVVATPKLIVAAPNRWVSSIGHMFDVVQANGFSKIDNTTCQHYISTNLRHKDHQKRQCPTRAISHRFGFWLCVCQVDRQDLRKEQRGWSAESSESEFNALISYRKTKMNYLQSETLEHWQGFRSKEALQAEIRELEANFELFHPQRFDQIVL